MIRKKSALDDLDLEIIGRLVADGRVSWANLGEALNLSAPAVAERVRKLEESGFIQGYGARCDHALLGAEVTAFVSVRLDRPKHRDGFLKRIQRLDAVLECHHVAGDDDYLVKVRVRRLAELEALVTDELKSIEGVAGTRTTIALSTAKETLAPPLSALGGDR